MCWAIPLLSANAYSYLVINTALVPRVGAISRSSIPFPYCHNIVSLFKEEILRFVAYAISSNTQMEDYQCAGLSISA
jgi:hypothetical protein